MSEHVAAIWEDAAEMDATLALRQEDLAALTTKRLRVRPYVRDQLFARMVKGEPTLIKHFPVNLKRSEPDSQTALTQLISTGFSPSHRARVQTGPSRRRGSLRIPEVIRRWEGKRAIVGVTDLHFRGTRFAQGLNFSALSDFDILCTDRELVHLIEMMTLVISSRGNVTDSHQDDCDGSNHCFVGKKLWLVWDRLEGKARGFQDVDRDQLTGWAAFDMSTFLSLPSSRWFIIKANETLFLPGNLAHKVITLEPYIGVGGFHVTLPGYLRSLKRWILYDTLDIKQKDLLGRINRVLMKKVQQVQKGGRLVKERWGLRHLQKAVKDWELHEESANKTILLRHSAFAALLQGSYSRKHCSTRHRRPPNAGLTRVTRIHRA